METETLALLDPSLAFEQDFYDLLDEYEQASESYDSYTGAAEDFAGHIQRLKSYAEGEGLPRGWVPYNTYWLVRDRERILAESQLRHSLTPALEIVGGHIGYTVRPSERRKGYGTLLLALTLEKARALGLKRVLLTCDSDNTGSARIMVKNGAVLTQEFYHLPSRKMKSHYWIDLEVQAWR